MTQRMTQHEAMQLLDCFPPKCSDVRHIRAAWAAKVRVTHPDTAPDVAAQAAENIKRYNMARDVLLQHVSDENFTCKFCKGSGVSKGRVGAAQCPACSGTGESI